MGVLVCTSPTFAQQFSELPFQVIGNEEGRQMVSDGYCSTEHLFGGGVIFDDSYMISGAYAGNGLLENDITSRTINSTNGVYVYPNATSEFAHISVIDDYGSGVFIDFLTVDPSGNDFPDIAEVLSFYVTADQPIRFAPIGANRLIQHGTETSYYPLTDGDPWTTDNLPLGDLIDVVCDNKFLLVDNGLGMSANFHVIDLADGTSTSQNISKSSTEPAVVHVMPNGRIHVREGAHVRIFVYGENSGLFSLESTKTLAGIPNWINPELTGFAVDHIQDVTYSMSVSGRRIGVYNENARLICSYEFAASSSLTVLRFDKVIDGVATFSGRGSNGGLTQNIEAFNTLRIPMPEVYSSVFQSDLSLDWYDFPEIVINPLYQQGSITSIGRQEYRAYIDANRFQVLADLDVQSQEFEDAIFATFDASLPGYDVVGLEAVEFTNDTTLTISLIAIEEGFNRMESPSTLSYYEIHPAQISTGIEEIAAFELAVSPNPATDQFKLTTDHRLMGATCSIIDVITGRTVHTSLVNQSEMYIQTYDLSSGTYMVRINNDDEIVERRIQILR